MDIPFASKAQIPNPALKPFEQLIGEWVTTGTHPGVGDKILNGKSSFQWMEGGAFLIWHSEISNDDRFPSGISIFGSDDGTGQWFMLYFDERKISRKYDVSFDNNILKWSRMAPRFSQRYTWTISEDGHTIIGKGELSKDGKTWEKDLEQTFTRIQ
jgi:hypothetical protein